MGRVTINYQKLKRQTLEAQVLQPLPQIFSHGCEWFLSVGTDCQCTTSDLKGTLKVLHDYSGPLFITTKILCLETNILNSK